MMVKMDKHVPAALSLKDGKALQMLLVTLVEDGNWIHLERALALQLFIDAARSLHKNVALFGANILHIVLRNGPSTDIIGSILQKFPETPSLPDSIGRHPLHIATSAGISSEIVETIAMAYPQACMKQDLDGRTPLHFACDASHALYEEEIHSPDRCRMNINTIICLVSIAPSSVLLEDMYEMNATELAILSNASTKVISLLQNESVLEHRKKRGQLKRGTLMRSLKEPVAFTLSPKDSAETKQMEHRETKTTPKKGNVLQSLMQISSLYTKGSITRMRPRPNHLTDFFNNEARCRY